MLQRLFAKIRKIILRKKVEKNKFEPWGFKTTSVITVSISPTGEKTVTVTPEIFQRILTDEEIKIIEFEKAKRGVNPKDN